MEGKGGRAIACPLKERREWRERKKGRSKEDRKERKWRERKQWEGFNGAIPPSCATKHIT